MQLIVNVTYGILIAIGLFLIGVPNAGLWGLLCAILRFIPYLGPIPGAAFPWRFLSLCLRDGLNRPRWDCSWLLKSSATISSLALLLQHGPVENGHRRLRNFWAWLWGGIGLLLATP
jgi:hypothetical protein